MAADGYLKAGYEYVIIDDCWLAKHRDPHGKLQADAQRFPSGMKALADYVGGVGWMELGGLDGVGWVGCR